MTAGADRPRPRFARFYERITDEMDRQGMSELRAELLADRTVHAAVLCLVLCAMPDRAAGFRVQQHRYLHYPGCPRSRPAPTRLDGRHVHDPHWRRSRGRRHDP